MCNKVHFRRKYIDSRHAMPQFSLFFVLIFNVPALLCLTMARRLILGTAQCSLFMHMIYWMAECFFAHAMRLDYIMRSLLTPLRHRQTAVF